MTDILLSDAMDIQIDPVTGEFITGESTMQQQKLLLLCDKNDFKDAPDRGVGLFGFLEDDNKDAMHRAVRIEFGRDNMVVKSISSINNLLKIDAPYEDS